MNTLCWLSAGDLIKQLPSGAVTSSRVVGATFARIAECEPTLNAVKVIGAGTYRVRVTGPAKGRYRITVVRSAR